jgi:hypothetical protein
MTRFSLFLVVVLQLLTGIAGALDPNAFKDLVINEEFRSFLSAMPVEMEAGGARLFREKGSLWLVSIGSTAVKPSSARELLRRDAVARAKAQANAVETLNGTQVESQNRLSTKVKITMINGAESAVSEEVLDETVLTVAKGLLQGMPVVGKWMDKTGQLYFIAIGKRVN